MERIPTSNKRKKLKRVALLLEHTDNQEGYNRLLKNLVPTWDFEIQKSAFIGEGHGPNNLNTYRKVKHNNTYFFEKVYFIDSPDFETIKWVNEILYPLIKDIINLPFIQKIHCGTEVAVVYFNYLSLKNTSSSKMEKEIIELAKQLILLSKNNFQKIESPTSPSIHDFKAHFIYQLYAPIAKYRLTKQSFDFTNLEKKVHTETLLFSHMDLHTKNVYKHSTVIDWDYFGLLPMGMEQARIYFLFLVHDYKIMPSSRWISTHFQDSIPTADWNAFSFNFNYFLYVFCCKFFENDDKIPLEKELLHHLSL